MSYAKPTDRFPGVNRLLLYVGVGFTVIVFGFPLYWMLISSLKPPQQITSYPPNLIPNTVTLENFVFLWAQTDFTIWITNSLIITAGNILLSVTLSALAAYGLSRYQIRGRKNIARAFIITYMFPHIMISFPYYLLYDNLGLLNTRIGLILVHTAITLPFTTWVMWQFFQTVPIEWEESAWTMGAPRYKTLLEIAMPGALPGLIASAIFAFGVSWNDFTFAFILTARPEARLMTTGVASFMQQTEIYWGPLMAGAAVLVIPPAILVLALNRYILAGFSIGGFE